MKADLEKSKPARVPVTEKKNPFSKTTNSKSRLRFVRLVNGTIHTENL